jgi:hypothetical protein
LTVLQYREILLSKVSQSLESDQICVTEFISVCRECDDSSDLEVTASVALILKEVASGNEDEEAEDDMGVKNNSVEDESLDEEERETSNIEVPSPQIPSSHGIPLQVWRYVNGGPLLDYSDIQSCSLFSTVRSFNWKEFGHTLRCINTEYKASEEPVLYAPSLTLIPKRDRDEIYYYTTPTGNIDSGNEVLNPRSSSSRRNTVNKPENSADESQEEAYSTRKRKKKQSEERERSPPTRKRVTPCQLIIYLDVNASNGKYHSEQQMRQTVAMMF